MNWKNYIASLMLIKSEIYKISGESYQDYKLPNVGARVADLLIFKRVLDFEIPDDYCEFLLHADGWESICLGLCLLPMAEASKAIPSIISNNAANIVEPEDLEISSEDFQKNYLLIADDPYAVNYVFLSKNSIQGRVIWCSSHFVKKFNSFSEFMVGVLSTNRIYLESSIDD